MADIKFYTDVHIAKEAVKQLISKGVDILHAVDVGMADADDITHLQFAIQNDRVMVSCDDDFIKLHAQYQADNFPHSGIVYFRMFEQCKSISLIVAEIILLHEASDYLADLYNQVWYVK